MLSRNPALTPEAVEQVLETTADDVEAPGFDTDTGWGRINAHAAVQAADTYQPYVLATYGSGLAGSGGLVPGILAPAGQVPSLGNASFAVDLLEALPSTPALLLLGGGSASLPFKGGTLLVDLSPLFLSFAHVTDGTGFARQPLPIPAKATLLGATFFAQWLVSDPAAVRGTALSRGIQVTLGS